LQGGRPRTGSATGVSTVGNTAVLGLGLTLTSTSKKSNKKKKGLVDLLHKRQKKKPSGAD
jgi:hypothetical protein